MAARFQLFRMLAAVALLVLATGALPSPAGRVLATPAPPLFWPPDGAVQEGMGLTLTWGVPPGGAQVHLQVIPANNDGPGVDVLLGSPETSFAIPEPPRWYGLLPDMTYTWRVRVSTATVPVAPADPSWSPWSARSFRTPKADSSRIAGAAPLDGFAVDSLTPTLTWADGRSDVFYYEVRLSKDPDFTSDPAIATAPVYSALIHGGVSAPRNSYVVPPQAPLENHTVYHWQVRPRIQGDGAPVAWSPRASFRTAAPQGPAPGWLEQLNGYRALGGLPPVIEHPAWSEACREHAAYLTAVDRLAHDQDPAHPAFTPAGDACGKNANVYISGSNRSGEGDALGNWATGPFHAIAQLNPRLRQVGFGSAGDDAGAVRYGAALDVWHGVDYRNPPAATFPLPWPGDGAVSPLRTYNGTEAPNPLSACPGYRAPAGAPILLQLGPAVADPAVTETSLSSDGVALEHCTFDYTSYANADPVSQESGRSSLGNGRNAVVVIPRAPLAPGTSYAVRVTAAGVTSAWSFSTAP